jgi:GalNAc-alpha-(1->4)-GalNAc-alpha-(1->3)-diNAcBac-PP-undecaprenol alpha-1,4-N-acetyl-D-galactosaminyltransferase
MRITLVSLSLELGGAERVLVHLAKGLLQRGHSVSVITFAGEDTDFYQLPAGIDRVALDSPQKSLPLLPSVHRNIGRLIRLRRTTARLIKLRQVIQKIQPDIIIAFTAPINILTVLVLFNTNYPIIGSEHNSPIDTPCSQPWESLRQNNYQHLQKLVSVSHGIDDELSWLAQTKRTVIYNPFLPIEKSLDPPNYPTGVLANKKLIVAMGRLAPQKGFDLLLRAFQQVKDDFPDWQLLILGDGNLRSELEQLREDLKLSASVVFAGNISHPFPLLQNAELFVLSSRTEGFPMAVGEALACGLPVIATDCCGGVRELIRDGIDGVLVANQDITALATAMKHLMSDEKARNRLASRTVEVVERFSLDKVLDCWETLIAEVLQQH